MKPSLFSRSFALQLIVTAVLTVLVVAGAYFLSTAGAQTPTPVASTTPPGVVKYAADSPQLSAIVVTPVRFEVIPVLEPQPGRVAYDENLTTRVSSPIAGRVLSTRIEIGDQVQAGQTLAQLDAPDLATAEADWQKARADDVRKQRAVERTRALFEAEVVARKDLEGAEADVNQAKSETRRTALRMRNLSATGAQNGVYNLKATLAGTVTERQINPGQEIRPDLAAPLFVITDLDRLWVIVDVPEQAAALLHKGQRAMVESEIWPGRTFDASVERIGLLLDPGTRRVQVRCRVQNQDRQLKPEMFAKVSFLPDRAGAEAGTKAGTKAGTTADAAVDPAVAAALSISAGASTSGSTRAGAGTSTAASAARGGENHPGLQAVALPNTSLFVEGRYSYVFVQTQPGTFERRRVHVHSTMRDRSFIDSGLGAGEAVVTEGAFLLTTEVGVNAR